MSRTGNTPKSKTVQSKKLAVTDDDDDDVRAVILCSDERTN